MLIEPGAILLVLVLLISGVGSNTDSENDHAANLVTIPLDVGVEGASVDSSPRDILKRFLPPKRTLDF